MLGIDPVHCRDSVKLVIHTMCDIAKNVEIYHHRIFNSVKCSE